MLPRLNVIFLLLCLSLQNEASQASTQLMASSFDQVCGPEVPCDSDKSLICAENICKCINSDEMMYDTIKKKCVVLSGKRCTHMTTNTSSPRGSQIEKLDCVAGALCNDDGYCDCSTLHFETPEGTCSPKLFNGKNCTIDNHCRTDRILSCQSGTCSCNISEAIYDLRRMTCVAIAGVECIKYGSKCVDRAVCSPLRHYDYRYVTAWEPVCDCLPEYKKSKRGLCLPSYNMSCGTGSGPSSCHEDFVCINGRCNCPFPKHQYNTGVNAESPCISYVGGPCLEKVGGDDNDDDPHEFRCDDHAHCKNSSGLFECQCNKGFIVSAERTCKIAHGGPCYANWDECDNVANLVCKNGKCSCQALEIYDEKDNICRGLVGAQCSGMDNILGYCVDGAECNLLRHSRSRLGFTDGGNWAGNGSCRCNSTSVTNANRTCSLL